VTQRLMTPEALEFVTQTSIATVKGFEDRAPKAEFRRVQIAHGSVRIKPCDGA